MSESSERKQYREVRIEDGTAAALFNRKNPFGPDGKQRPFPLDRYGKDKSGPNYYFNEGKDVFGLSPGSEYKRRIPNTSVVNKVCVYRVFGCCGPRMTAAQYIWRVQLDLNPNPCRPFLIQHCAVLNGRNLSFLFLNLQQSLPHDRWLNLLCFVVHTIMVIVTLHMGQWRWEEERGDDRSFMEVRIFRIVGNWTSANANGYDFVLKDNGMPINVAWLTASFFGISAAFHLWAVVFGIFEATWYWYWRYALRWLPPPLLPRI